MSVVDDENEPNESGDYRVATVPADPLAQPRRLITGHIRWRATFAAFQHRNYRLFFGGQMVSLVGTWMQTVAEGWLVYQLTSSPFALGMIRFLHTIPITALAILGGALADRANKRRILIGAQTASMFLALILFLLVQTGWVQVWHIAVVGLCLGVAHAFDIPTRQSFVVEMVGKRDLMNAIALNSSMFNSARVFGPAVAGLLIGWAGVGVCFLANAFSFLAVIAGYSLMRLPKQAPAPPAQSLGQATLEAAQYVWRQADLRSLLALVAVVSLFGWPYSVLMPAFARDVLHVGADGYGWLMSANGAGALLGALTLASLGNYRNRRRLVWIGVIGFSASVLFFAVSKWMWVSALVLVVAGWCMIVFFATANTSIQLRVPDALRGRVMGIYSFCFIGISPFGSLAAGALAKATSVPVAVALGAVICLIAGTAYIIESRSNGDLQGEGSAPKVPRSSSR